MAEFLRYIAASFMVGVFVRSFFAIPPIFTGIIAICGLIFAAIIFVRHRVSNKSNKVVAWISAAILFGAALGIFRYDAATRLPMSPFALEIGKNIILNGMIAAEPEQKERYQRTVLAVNDEKVLIYAPRYPELKYGDIVEARGKLTEPENFNDSAAAGRVFDWRAYLAKDGVHYEMKNAAIVVTGDGGSRIKKMLFAVADDFKKRIRILIPEPKAGLLNGIILGDKSGLTAAIKEDFRLAGVTHLVALSGYNISVVADGARRAVGFLPIGAAAAQGAGLFAVALFVVMTGASTTAIRAGLMAAVIVFARASGRLYTANNALFAAAFLMILWNPLILKDDISFQLSFLATWGIVNIAPYFLKEFERLPFAAFREMLATTLAAQLLVMPLLLYSMGYLSLISLPANLAILPVIPATMAGGFAIYFLSFLPVIAYPAAWATDLLLRYELFSAHFFGALPFSGTEIASFSGALVILSYAAIFYWHREMIKNNERTKTAIPTN